MPFAYSTDKNSPFFKQVQQVYEVSKMMVANGDNSEEMKIAQFWDCNPYVTVTQGHMAFAKKKISPGAHWIGIVKIACKKTKVDFDTTVFAYTKASIGIFEGFISCWEAKYNTNVVRPETIINQNIDENWRPLLQTPPFPEYTSGHSVVSTCSSKLLTNIFGENFAFSDDTELQFGLPTRSYTSFDQAAKEAAMSRFYGGIHFMAAITNGSKQGAAIGDYLNIKLKMRN
jgi:hypothetical protein